MSVLRPVISFVLLFLLLGCSSDSENARVVADWHGTLAEGESRSWSMSPGTYRLEMTSNPNGASVQWLPSSGCTNVSEVREYHWDCKLDIKGQLIISNPTTFGLGPTEIVTVRISKL